MPSIPTLRAPPSPAWPLPLLLALAACGAGGDAASSPSPAVDTSVVASPQGTTGDDIAPVAAAASGALALAACTVPGSDEPVRCGSLSVPENRDVPDGRHIDLHVVVIPAVAAAPSLPPLYDLAGGPGLGATDGAAFYLTDGRAQRQQRDIVLVDQRGTGRSAPLECPEFAGTGARFPDEGVRACRTRLAAQADLSAYTTAATVTDLQAVRTALGHDVVDLFGISYGTRVALAWIAAEPSAIRAATLVGTVPDDARLPLWYARHAEDALRQVFADCTADRACRVVFRDLEQDWERLLARPDFDGAARETFRNVLASTPGQRRVPRIVAHLADGGPPDEAPPSGGFADGLFLSVTCAEDTAWIEEDAVAAATAGTFLGDWRVRRQQAACALWDVPRRELRYAREPSDVPVLFIAGGRDHVTPVAWAERVAAAFPRGRVVVVPKLGHFPDGLANMACLDTLMLAFAQDTDLRKLDTSCVATMRAPNFAGPYRAR